MPLTSDMASPGRAGGHRTGAASCPDRHGGSGRATAAGPAPGPLAVASTDRLEGYLNPILRRPPCDAAGNSTHRFTGAHVEPRHGLVDPELALLADRLDELPGALGQRLDELLHALVG